MTEMLVSTATFQNNLGNPVLERQTILDFVAARNDAGNAVPVVTTGTLTHATIQLNHYSLHHQHTNTRLLLAGCPSCHPANSFKALKAIFKADAIDCSK